MPRTLLGTEDVKGREAVHDFNESSGKDKVKTDLMQKNVHFSASFNKDNLLHQGSK